MKKSILLVVALVFSLTSFGQDGIQFAEGSWADILAKAKEADKVVFVDAYTTWCGPCKWMAANSFPDKKVGEFYNSNFINAKIDMEKGEGIDIAKKFEIRAYPTLLFVNGDGELVHRAVGARDAAGLLTLGATANNPETQLMGLTKRYESGEKNAEFLKMYANTLKDSGMQNYQEVVNGYLKAQTDLLTKENVEFIYDFTFSADDAYYGFMVKNKAKFDEIIGQDEMNARFKRAITYPMYREQDVDFDMVKASLADVFSAAEAKQYTDEFKMNYYSYRIKNDDFKKKYLEAVVAYMDKYDVKDWQQLNSNAWTVYENTTDEAILIKACGWAEKSVELEENFYNTDTVAHICHQLGKKRRAKKYAKMAIKLGEADGEDVSLTQDLLEKINSL